MTTMQTELIKIELDNMMDIATKNGWKVIPENIEEDTRNFIIQGIYFVSPWGKVVKMKNLKFKECTASKSGNYQTVNIATDSKNKNVKIQRLVYGTFHHVKMVKGMAIHHVNGIKTDEGNNIENLRMISIGDNVSQFFSNYKGETNKWLINQQYEDGYDLEAEQWKLNQNYGLYVSNMGRIKGKKGNVMSQSLANKKYPNNWIVGYAGVGKHSSVSVQKLVAETWLITPDCKFKTLIKDATLPLNERFKASNLYIVPTNKGVK